MNSLIPSVYIAQLGQNVSGIHDIVCFDYEKFGQDVKRVEEVMQQALVPLYNSVVVLYSQMKKHDREQLRITLSIPHQKLVYYNPLATLDEQTQSLRVHFWNHTELFDPKRVLQWTRGNPESDLDCSYFPLPAGRFPKTYATLLEGYIEPKRKHSHKK